MTCLCFADECNDCRVAGSALDYRVVGFISQLLETDGDIYFY